jgi:Arc/MetJ family transcription regulator
MQETLMRTTITLDDELMKQAANYTGIKEKAALVKEALTRLVRNEAARRLAALGGSDPAAQAAPRRPAAIAGRVKSPDKQQICR